MAIIVMQFQIKKITQEMKFHMMIQALWAVLCGGICTHFGICKTYETFDTCLLR